MTEPIMIMGAHGGIGEALAKALDDMGYPLFLTARNKDDITLQGHPKASVDVTDPDTIKDAIEKADQGEGIKGLAYCIGSIDLKPFKSTTDEDFMQVYDLNVLGGVRALRYAENALKKAKGKGSVVLFSSIAAQNGFPQHSAIACAKGAVEGLVRTLAAEWAPHVRVNAIAPSLTDTGIAKGITSSDQMAQAIAKMHPIPRLGTAEDSAHMAAFLLGDQSDWITGQVFAVDGGRSRVRNKG